MTLPEKIEPQLPDSYPAIRSGSRGVQLETMADMFRFATAVMQSGMAPKGYNTPQAVLIAIQWGAELGLGPMQSLSGIAIINGRPSLYGDTLKALVESRPECEYVKEWMADGGKTAICEVKRVGRPSAHRSEYTEADARTAKLWGKAGPWTQYPKRMLAMRARSFALRDQFADLLCGFATTEELQDITEPEPAKIESGDTVEQDALDLIAETLPDVAGDVAGEPVSIVEDKQAEAMATGLDAIPSQVSPLPDNPQTPGF